MSHKSHTSCLFKVPIFSHLNEDEQLGITELIKVKKLNKGDLLYNTGENGSFLYVVNKGKIKVSKYTEDGNEQVLRILTNGEFAGDHALFTTNLSTDFAVSLEDTTVCILEGKVLKEHMSKNPEISLRIINELSKRLVDTEDKLSGYNLSSVEQRLAESIIKLSGSEDRFILPMSKLDWSSILGMSNETLSRRLRSFKNLGLIDLKGQREIIILNKNGLKDII